MSRETSLDRIKRHLFTDASQLDGVLTPAEMEVRQRLMLCVTRKMDSPLTSDKDLVDFLMSGCGGVTSPVGKSQTYRDVAAVTSMVGDIRPAAKNWMRHMIVEGSKRVFDMAMANKDAKGAAAALDKIGKYTRCDKNGIHFWNGTFIVVLSFNQGMSANSMSLDWVMGPEAKFLDYEKIKSEVNPANRGNEQYFGSCPHHHSVCYTTDMPCSKAGRWILDKEQEMSPQHINYLRNVYRELKETERRTDLTQEYLQRRLRELRHDLDLARKYQPPVIPSEGKKREFTVYYGEYDIFDNLEVVGEDYIWQMYRDSPPLIWQTAFLNKRIFKIPNCFYSALDDESTSTYPRTQASLTAYRATGRPSGQPPATASVTMTLTSQRPCTSPSTATPPSHQRLWPSTPSTR